MVRALLDGSKTQTRRAVKLTESGRVKEPGGYRRWYPADKQAVLACPYGIPGGHLWVREAHWWFKDEHDPVTGYYPPKLTSDDVEYRADGDDGRTVWRPSIHMPRWASRITLEITGVRVERLHDISWGDAMAEGCPFPNMAQGDDPRKWYADLWNSISGPGSWDANPFVWVVEFKRVET